jgi:hypothetical protein
MVDWSEHGHRLPMSKAEVEKQHERPGVNRFSSHGAAPI